MEFLLADCSCLHVNFWAEVNYERHPLYGWGYERVLDADPGSANCVLTRVM
jgi:hypothetical protein